MSSSACSRPVRRLGQRGTGTVEFTLVAAILMTAFLAIVELARYEAALGGVRAATAEAARAALIDTALSGCTTPEARVAARAPGLDAARLSVCVTRGMAGGLQEVRVDSAYDFAFSLPVFGSLNRRLTDVAVARF
jgi:Flp pilus assembly protein TadG